MSSEIWLNVKIAGYADEYKVSSLGNVWSEKAQRLMRPVLNKATGYTEVSLHSNGVRKVVYVHRLVALTFYGEDLTKPHVNHINGVRNDNRLENLEWVTVSENIRHAIDVLGSSTRSRAKLTIDDVKRIKVMIHNGETNIAISKRFPGVDKSSISAIRIGRNWNDVEVCH